MGVYVDIRNKNTGYKLTEGKYGIGFPILMFSRFNGDGKKNVVFEATGAEAMANIDKALAYLNANVNVKNADALLIIKGDLLGIRDQLNPNDVYVSDYSENMMAIDNPNFNPMSFVQEYQFKLEDAVHGYATVCRRDDASMIKMLEHFANHLSGDIRTYACKNSDKYIVLEASVFLSNDDVDFLNGYMHCDPKQDDYGFGERYAERKLFYLMKKSGFEFEICNMGNNKYHVVLSTPSIKDWWATRPYVMCSYRLSSTYDIYYFVRNLPEELEKFYVHAKEQKNVVSIVVNNMELILASNDEVASCIGKPLTLSTCEYTDIDMKYV